jgi:hypothetical protein
MGEVLPGRAAKDRFAWQQARASMRDNSESVSNEIDESEWQDEKHDEQRM